MGVENTIQTHFEEILSSVLCAQPANKCLLSHACSQELHKCGRNTYSCFAQPRPPLYTCQYSCSPQILMVKNYFNNSAGCSQELHNCGLDISGCFAQSSSEENVTAIAQYPPFSQRNQCLEKNI